MVERHSGMILKLANNLLIHARLKRKFIYYSVTYAQYIRDVIPVKDLNDKCGFPMTPYAMATNRKHPVNYFRVCGNMANFKRYVKNDKGKTMKNKYNIKQGVIGIFVRIPDDSALNLRHDVTY